MARALAPLLCNTLGDRLGRGSGPEEAGESRRSVEPVSQAMRLNAPRRAIADLASLRHEAELGDHPRRGGIVGEMADGEIVEAVPLEGVDDERAHRLARIAQAPIGLPDPIAELCMVLAKGAIAGAADEEA